LILGTLKTGDFTDVVILAYTNPAKDPNAFTNDLHTEWEKLQTEPFKKHFVLSREKTQQIVDAVSNTVTGTYDIHWVAEKRTCHRWNITANLQIVRKNLNI
jgi:hypothetical protein